MATSGTLLILVSILANVEGRRYVDKSRTTSFENIEMTTMMSRMRLSEQVDYALAFGNTSDLMDVQTSENDSRFGDVAGLQLGDICDGLEDCKLSKTLHGGAVAQTGIAVYKGKMVVIKQDEPNRLKSEVSTYQTLARAPWFAEFIPKLYESTCDIKLETSCKMVLEYLQPPTTANACGWSDLGALIQGPASQRFVTGTEFSIQKAAQHWSAVLMALNALKQHDWQHCDLHSYNLVVHTCDTKVKVIDWERGHVGGSCGRSRMPDLQKLLLTFGGLFFDVGTNSLHMSMSGSLAQGDRSMCKKCQEYKWVERSLQAIIKYRGEEEIPKQVEGISELVGFATHLLEELNLDVPFQKPLIAKSEQPPVSYDAERSKLRPVKPPEANSEQASFSYDAERSKLKSVKPEAKSGPPGAKSEQASALYDRRKLKPVNSGPPEAKSEQASALYDRRKLKAVNSGPPEAKSE